jgi:hypothetical protein
MQFSHDNDTILICALLWCRQFHQQQGDDTMAIKDNLMNNDIAGAAKDFKESANRGIGRMADAAHETVDRAESGVKSRVELIDTVGRRVTDRVVHAADRIRNVGHRVEEEASERWGMLKSRIEDKPVTSAAIAFGIGYLAASLFSRRKSSRYDS